MSKAPYRGPPGPQPNQKKHSSSPFSNDGDMMFNKTSLLSSALEKLKSKKGSTPKRIN